MAYQTGNGLDEGHETALGVVMSTLVDSRLATTNAAFRLSIDRRLNYPLITGVFQAHGY